ncbi:hypothetical protein [Paludisphaera borealis]|uniref:CARDB domain-containing protein n=1 Tax=Paludisphaera borealis TaxID=1387353 RepID=A0A1U7CQ31_9BACT|nr:hypothetical protein [Paludisphaera borealis]APW61019.1 hypothetical protein BSF38_02522 [Paludisphaera borealis]
MLPRDYLRARHDRRARRRTDLTALEALEERQLMAYSSLGFSLSDLQISGQSAPTANWGGTVTLKITVQNTGASTIVEPLSLVPSQQIQNGPDGLPVPPYELPSSSDAIGTQIGVYLVPNGRSLSRGVKVASIAAPALLQNSLDQFETDVTLPSRPQGFPADGRFTIRLVANENRTALESNYRNNVSPPISVRIFNTPATAALRAITLDLPAGLQPGDTVAPYIQIANVGTAAIPADTPVEVALVASTTPDFNLGSSIISVYTVRGGILGTNSTPLPTLGHHFRRSIAANLKGNITTPSNVVTIRGGNATLPASPDKYYVGVVIDPYNKLNLTNQPTDRLELSQLVQGGSLSGLGSSGVVSTANTGLFPNPPDGVPIGIV